MTVGSKWHEFTGRVRSAGQGMPRGHLTLVRVRSSTFSSRGIKRRGGAVATAPGCDPRRTKVY